jgi:hypothetical protein
VRRTRHERWDERRATRRTTQRTRHERTRHERGRARTAAGGAGVRTRTAMEGRHGWQAWSRVIQAWMPAVRRTPERHDERAVRQDSERRSGHGCPAGGRRTRRAWMPELSLLHLKQPAGHRRNAVEKERHVSGLAGDPSLDGPGLGAFRLGLRLCFGTAKGVLNIRPTAP